MKLVLHHRYHDDLAWDLSGNFNHGTWENATSGPQGEGVRIHGVGSRVWVHPSASLSGLVQMRVLVTFFVQSLPIGFAAAIVAPDDLPSLFLLPSGHLSVRNLGAPGVTCDSPNALAPGQWADVEYFHDGRNTCILSVGRATQFQTSANRLIHAVGGAGLSVGNLPVASAIAQTPLLVRELQVFKFDLLEGVRCISDVSHVKRADLGQLFDGLRADGATAGSLSQLVYATLLLGQRIGAVSCAGSTARTNKLNDLGAEMGQALSNGDMKKVESVADEVRNHLIATLTPAQIAEYQGHAQALIDAIPKSIADPKRAADVLRMFHVPGY